jgi:hypothetical protein
VRLRHNQRRGLCVGWRGYQWQRRKSSRGKQHETKFGHDDLWSPGKILATNGYLLNKQASPAINGQALGRIVAAFKSKFVFILNMESRQAPLFMGHSDDPGSAHRPAASVAAYGTRGPSGPRNGNSPGISPGNSCGGGSWPGSCVGGGISGLGLPEGSSGGGSAGRPGLIGGSSKGSIEGSIGISQFPKVHLVLQRRNGGNVPRSHPIRAPAACGSCRPECGCALTGCGSMAITFRLSPT